MPKRKNDGRCRPDLQNKAPYLLDHPFSKDDAQPDQPPGGIRPERGVKAAQQLPGLDQRHLHGSEQPMDAAVNALRRLRCRATSTSGRGG